MFEKILLKLNKSKFRRRFVLSDKDIAYIEKKGMETIRSHAIDFVRDRIAPEFIANDGKQTPYRNHPVFVAQHATATCCRSCVEKWHHFKRGVALTGEQQAYLVGLIMVWMQSQYTIASNYLEEHARQG
jgi:hypothetical protein